MLNVGALPAEPEARPSRSGPAPRRSSDDTAEAPQARQDQTAEVVSERPSTVGRRTIAGPPPHEKRARKLRSYLVDGFVATGIAAAFIMVGITAAQKHAANVAKHAPRPAPSATPLPPEASEEDQLKSREMMTKGDQAAAAEKLADARWYYEQAWKLNRRCEPCRSRLRHVEYAMISQIHAALLAAPKDIDAAQYDDAIRELEKVQQLARDPKSRDYQEAMRLLEIAKKRKEGT